MRSRRAYSLIELLTVLAVISILSAIMIPSVSGVLRGTQLSGAGQTAAEQLTLARQDAITRNRSVLVRVYQTSDGACGIGSDLLEDDGSSVPLRRIIWMPESVQISSDLTTLNGSPYGTTGSMNLPPLGSVSFFAFIFRPDGSLGTSAFTTNAPYFTLINKGSQTSPPKNFYAMQINPATGRVERYRP